MEKVSMAYYINVGISLSICMCPSICLSIHACFHPIWLFFIAILKFQILRWCWAMGVQSKKNSMSFFKSSINFVLPPFQWWLQTFLVGDIFNKNEIMSSDVSGVVLDAWLVYSPLIFGVFFALFTSGLPSLWLMVNCLSNFCCWIITAPSYFPHQCNVDQTRQDLFGTSSAAFQKVNIYRLIAR